MPQPPGEIPPAPAFPPEKSVLLDPTTTAFGPPGVLIVPPIPGGHPPPPPCDKEHDKDCKPPPCEGEDCKPPHEAPEPGTWLILLAGAAALAFGWLLKKTRR